MSKTIDAKALYELALKKWGAEFQLAQTIEECAELIVEIRKRARNRNSIADLLREVADVRIMLEQIEFMLADPGDMELLRDEKLTKLAKYLNVNPYSPKEIVEPGCPRCPSTDFEFADLVSGKFKCLGCGYEGKLSSAVATVTGEEA